MGRDNGEVINKAGFSAFLREQRHSLTPHEAGLPSTVHRRTPGLRRQEVAQLAGISIDYYIKLEQGRGATPSAQVLSALARALLLTQDERNYLFHLAGDTSQHTTEPSTSVSSSVRFLIENMPEVPAYVVDAAWNVLAWNDLAEYFIGELTRMPPTDRNLARWMFRAPIDHPHWSSPSSHAFAQIVATDLRSSFLRYPHFAEINLLTAELNSVSPMFHDLWERKLEAVPAVQKKLTIPNRGEFLFDCQMLRIADTGQQLVTYCAEPGSPVRDALRDFADGDLTAAPQAVRYLS
jgi:transcriptional regulator with XRE-family HTH domain